MKKESVLEIVLGITIVLVIVAYLGLSYLKKQSKNKEYTYHTSYFAGELTRNYLSEIKDGVPEQFEVEIAGIKYVGQVMDMFYSLEYDRYVCRYSCNDEAIVYCIYDEGKVDFLSVTFIRPIVLFENSTEENIKRELEMYVGDKEDYKFHCVSIEDMICYGYIKFVNEIATADGIRITMDEAGKVHEISKYNIKESIDNINQEEVEEAENQLRQAVYNKYKAEFEILDQQLLVLEKQGNAINYILKVEGVKDVVRYHVTWQQVRVEPCCES